MGYTLPFWKQIITLFRLQITYSQSAVMNVCISYNLQLSCSIWDTLHGGKNTEHQHELKKIINQSQTETGNNITNIFWFMDHKAKLFYNLGINTVSRIL